MPMRTLTTLLDILGCLAIVVGAALFVAQWSWPGAVALFGAGLIAVSWIADRIPGKGGGAE